MPVRSAVEISLPSWPSTAPLMSGAGSRSSGGMIVTDFSAPTYPAWLPARVGSSAPVAEQPASSTTASITSGATTDRQLDAVGSARARGFCSVC